MPLWIPGILMTCGAFLFAVASPGPNVLAIMGVSMCEGLKAGIALAFGIAAGSLSWSLLSVLGLSAVLATYAAALSAIKIIGGCYLLWLGAKAFRSAIGYAVGFSTPLMLHFYRRARRCLKASFGAFFIYAGGRLLTDRS